jgi:hypothetical protein
MPLRAPSEHSAGVAMRVNLALATSSLSVKLQARERDFAPASPVEYGGHPGG